MANHSLSVKSGERLLNHAKVQMNGKKTAQSYPKREINAKNVFSYL